MFSSKRLSDDSIPHVGTSAYVCTKLVIPSLKDNRIFNNFGGNCLEYEFSAMLNGGEQVRAKFADPYFSVYKNFIGNDYFNYSRVGTDFTTLESSVGWNVDKKLESQDLRTELQTHTLVTMAPSGRSSSAEIDLLAIDTPSYILSAGNAGGYCYSGSVSSVIKQVIERYGKGRCKVRLDTNTIDNKNNKWWQMRMDPKTFVLSLLDWSTSLSDKKTKWFLYPDDRTLIVTEQAAVESRQRATYEWRGFGGQADKRTGDILEWEFIGDNALQMLNEYIVTSGISSVSGAYYDQSKYRNPLSTVYVGDIHTQNKYSPYVGQTGKLGGDKDVCKSYDKPLDICDPLFSVVGWSSSPSIPEPSAGEMGLKYDEYIDGKARGIYLSSSMTLMRMRFRVMGHYIWSGSEGLGADTIYITLTSSTDGAPPYFVAGNWIVYGFNHIYRPGTWVTDIYCYRLDRDSLSKPVGKMN